MNSALIFFALRATDDVLREIACGGDEALVQKWTSICILRYMTQP